MYVLSLMLYVLFGLPDYVCFSFYLLYSGLSCKTDLDLNEITWLNKCSIYKWGNILWRNGFHPPNRAPQTWQGALMLFWRSWWPDSILRHFMLLFPFICHPSVFSVLQHKTMIVKFNVNWTFYLKYWSFHTDEDKRFERLFYGPHLCWHRHMENHILIKSSLHQLSWISKEKQSFFSDVEISHVSVPPIAWINFKLFRL